MRPGSIDLLLDALLHRRLMHEGALEEGTEMSYDGIEAAMSKRELIARELDHMPEQDVDKLLAFLRALKEAHTEASMPTLAAESSLAKDWLTPEEDSAWANL